MGETKASVKQINNNFPCSVLLSTIEMTSKYSKFKWNNRSQVSVISIGKFSSTIALNQSARDKSLSHWKIDNGVKACQVKFLGKVWGVLNLVNGSCLEELHDADALLPYNTFKMQNVI